MSGGCRNLAEWKIISDLYRNATAARTYLVCGLHRDSLLRTLRQGRMVYDPVIEPFQDASVPAATKVKTRPAVKVKTRPVEPVMTWFTLWQMRNVDPGDEELHTIGERAMEQLLAAEELYDDICDPGTATSMPDVLDIHLDVRAASRAQARRRFDQVVNEALGET